MRDVSIVIWLTDKMEISIDERHELFGRGRKIVLRCNIPSIKLDGFLIDEPISLRSMLDQTIHMIILMMIAAMKE